MGSQKVRHNVLAEQQQQIKFNHFFLFRYAEPSFTASQGAASRGLTPRPFWPAFLVPNSCTAASASGSCTDTVHLTPSKMAEAVQRGCAASWQELERYSCACAPLQNYPSPAGGRGRHKLSNCQWWVARTPSLERKLDRLHSLIWGERFPCLWNRT